MEPLNDDKEFRAGAERSCRQTGMSLRSKQEQDDKSSQIYCQQVLYFKLGSGNSVTDVNCRGMTIFPFRNNHTGNDVEESQKGGQNVSPQMKK